MEVAVEFGGKDNFLVSKKYENSLSLQKKKENGVYYTPKIIVDYIIESTLKNHDYIKNPAPKVIDLSCGCGNFLLEAYDILYSSLMKNILEINKIHGKNYINKYNIHRHIIENCIYGCDIDKEAVEILKDSLRNKSGECEIEIQNIIVEDSLKYNWSFKFDYIIGNPPYIGHKMLDKDYKKYLLENYNEVYKDKSDMYFCYFKKIYDILAFDGISSIIIPRYFIESPSGKNLRNYISTNISIKEIVDFLGMIIFPGIGVSSSIVTFGNIKNNFNQNILRIKNECTDIGKIYSLEKLIKEDKFESLKLSKNIDNDWVLFNYEDEIFYNKIEETCKYTIEDLVTSFQGIITGCDKAFILNEDKDKNMNKIDNLILKKWVKNSNIEKYILKESNLKLIYSNDLDLDDNNHKYTLDTYISPYKYKLENRRECRKNIRKWYELQWGRDKSSFEKTKIMYPYKSRENKFAIDYNGNFCSADVYSFSIKEKYEDEFSYEYLVGILNSSIYNRYFKITAKKIARNLYDYYPNKVMKLKLFKDENYEKIEKLSLEIINEYSKVEIDSCLINHCQNEIDKLVTKSLKVDSLLQPLFHITI